MALPKHFICEIIFISIDKKIDFHYGYPENILFTKLHVQIT